MALASRHTLHQNLTHRVDHAIFATPTASFAASCLLSEKRTSFRLESSAARLTQQELGDLPQQRVRQHLCRLLEPVRCVRIGAALASLLQFASHLDILPPVVLRGRRGGGAR